MSRRRPQLPDRAAPLLEEAAERSRISWRARLERLRLAWRSIFQAALSAGIAWLIATELLGHQQAFFAPVAAIVTLGLTVSQRGRRAVELAVGGGRNDARGATAGPVAPLGTPRRWSRRDLFRRRHVPSVPLIARLIWGCSGTQP